MAALEGSIQLLTNTAANWTNNNPILLEGQIGIETDGLTTTPKFKIGDGTTAWNSLPYASSSGGGLSGLTTNQYLKAGSATTAEDALLSDDGTNVILPSGKKITGADIAKVNIDFGTTGSEYLAITTDAGAYAKPYLYLINDSGGQDLVELFVDGGINGMSVAKATGALSFLAANSVIINAPSVAISGDLTLASETASTIAHIDANKEVKSLSTSIYPNLTELARVKGLLTSLADYDELEDLSLQTYYNA